MPGNGLSQLMGWGRAAGDTPAEEALPPSSHATKENATPQAVAATTALQSNSNPQEMVLVPSQTLSDNPEGLHPLTSNNPAIANAAPTAATVEAAHEIDIPVDADTAEPLEDEPEGVDHPTPAVARPEPTIHRQTAAAYTPPVAKAVQKLKRTELKRQLKDRVQAPVIAKPMKISKPAPPASKSKGTSRGSRLANLAAVAAPLPYVSMPVQPVSKRPLSVFGMVDTHISNQQLTELVSVEDGLAVPEANVGSAVEHSSEQVPPTTDGAAAAGSVEMPVAESHTDNSVRATQGQGGEVADQTATEENSADGCAEPSMGSAISFGQWGAPVSTQMTTAGQSPHTLEQADVEIGNLHRSQTAAATPTAETLTPNCEEEATEAQAAVGINTMEEMEATPEPEPSLQLCALQSYMARTSAAADSHQVEIAPAVAADTPAVPQTDEVEQESTRAGHAMLMEDNDAVPMEEESPNDLSHEDSPPPRNSGNDQLQQGWNQFAALPRLLPRWGPTNSNGNDSSMTSPSSCSLLPPGLSGSHSPRMRKSSARHEEENDSHQAPRADKGAIGEEGGRRVRFSGIGEEILDINEALDVLKNVDSSTQVGDQERMTNNSNSSRSLLVAPTGKAPLPPLSRSNSAKASIVNAPQSRFGIGAFIRMPVGGSSNNSHAPAGGSLMTNVQHQQNSFGGLHTDIGGTSSEHPTGSAYDKFSSLIGGGKKENSLKESSNDAENGAEEENPTPPLVITRRLQHSGTTLRRNVIPLSVPSSLYNADSVPQVLREAFLNARLAENYNQGEAWARLDLCGIEIDQETGRSAHLNTVINTVTGQRGEAAVRAALEQLETEWGHLRCLRQRYVSSPADNDDSDAPKSILKHASGVSPLPAKATAAAGMDPSQAAALGGSADQTPPLHIRCGQLVDTTGPGSNEGLPHEMMTHQGSLSPLEWGAAAVTRHIGVQGQMRDAPRRGRVTGPLDVTPNMAVRSRGIKMLASLQQTNSSTSGVVGTATGTTIGTAANGASWNVVSGESGGLPATGVATTGVATIIGASTDGVASKVPEMAQYIGQQHLGKRVKFQPSLTHQDQRPSTKPPSRSEGLRKGGSRGQRLLQALQNAAGPGQQNGSQSTPPGVAAAAAAARLIVEPHGGTAFGTAKVHAVPSPGPVATNFVIS